MTLSPDNMRIVYFVIGFLLIGMALKFLRRMAGVMYSVIILAVYLIMNGFIKADSLWDALYMIREWFFKLRNFIGPFAVNVLNNIGTFINKIIH